MAYTTPVRPRITKESQAHLPQRIPRLGVRPENGGVEVAVHAPEADTVYFCVLRGPRENLTEERHELRPGAYGNHIGFIPGITEGTHYGFRVTGQWEPARASRFNVNKLLIDPYARGIDSVTELSPALYAHEVDDDLAGDGQTPSELDSASVISHSVVMPNSTFSPAQNRPHIPWEKTIIYEGHVRGLTIQHPDVPEDLRGTYAGLAHPAMLDHLHRLGITSIELLPIHAFFSEPALLQRGAGNYWGYNTANYFSPHPAYATAAAQAQGPQAVLDEFKGMVHLLHEAGLELLLDVVYNHTAEGGPLGPTLSWRGLDDRGYYLRVPHHSDQYWDMTGVGNTLDFRNPWVVQMTLDSLRYWVDEVGIDGFRFDLASTLGRRADSFDPSHPLWVALSTDPTFADVKLIAEPWDVGPDGWQTGRYHAPVAEWNDRYRDTLRTFWLADRGAIEAGEPGTDLRDLATRLAGSADMFAGELPQGLRGPTSSINYITSHDGFTMADLTAFHTKRNEANGEENRDGTDNNRSFNHGVEGETEDAQVLAARRHSVRNMLASLLLSAGTPMITAGDELGRTQQGNNNAYCQDSPIAWVDWRLEDWQQELIQTTARLIRIRRDNPALRPLFFRALPDRRHRLRWFDESGEPMSADQWSNPHHRAIQMFRDVDIDRDALVLINGAAVPVDYVLAAGQPWDLQWSSSDTAPGEVQQFESNGLFTLDPMSIAIFIGRPHGPSQAEQPSD